MSINDSQTPPPLPGVIASLTAGFHLVANQAALFLFPLGFDIFLWLGSRLSVSRLFEPLLQQMFAALSTPESPLENVDLILEFWRNFNLLAAMRTLPLGVFSLMSSNTAAISPLGTRLQWEISSPGELLLAWIGLTVLGWGLGSAYFARVGQSSLGEEKPPFSFGRAWGQGFVYSALWNLIALALTLPLFFFVGVLAWINIGVALLGMSLIFLFGMWLLIPVFFSAYAIFIQGRNVFDSLRHGLHVVRYGAPSLAMFSLAAFFLSQGFDFLWRAAPAESGFALAGIFGHAFISTGLLAASFIHYRALDNWIDAANRWLSANSPVR